ncbi:triacylglycerol lipase, partial [Corynebacterium bovis]
GVPTPVRMTQILYRTTDALDRPSATVTSVLHPLNPSGVVPPPRATSSASVTSPSPSPASPPRSA